MPPRSIRLYLLDGSPTGLRTAEIGLSTCLAVACPRVSLAALQARPEASRTGVYVLIGEDDPRHPGRTAVYVGEGDEVFKRIRRHELKKEFWDRVVFFVSKDENLTKAHARYLEAELIALGREANRAFITNDRNPEGGRLPESEKAEMIQFLDQIRILLGVFGIFEFEPLRTRAKQESPGKGPAPALPAASPVFYLKMGGIEAEGVLNETGFVVRKGSQARSQAQSSCESFHQARREELLASGVLVAKNRQLVFAKNVEFPSPSTAATVLMGTNQNGRLAWKLADGTTLKDWQERDIAEE